MAMDLLTQHPLNDAEANAAWRNVPGGTAPIETKALIALQNLQSQINVLKARLDAAAIP